MWVSPPPHVVVFTVATVLAICSVIVFIVLVVCCPIILPRVFATMIACTVSRLDALHAEEKLILLNCIYSD